MILYKLIKLPFNLLIELLRYSDKLEDKNSGYIMYLWNELKDRFKK